MPSDDDVAEAAALEGRNAAKQAWSYYEQVGDRLKELTRDHDNDAAAEAHREVEDLVSDLDDALAEAQEVFDDVAE